MPPGNSGSNRPAGLIPAGAGCFRRHERTGDGRRLSVWPITALARRASDPDTWLSPWLPSDGAEWPAAKGWCKPDRRCIHPEGLRLRSGDHIREDQVFPDLGPQFNPVLYPGFHSIRGAGWDRFAFVRAFQRADLLAIDWLAPFAALGQRRIAASSEVGRQAQ